MTGIQWTDRVWSPALENLSKPLHWRKPSRVSVKSDLFDESHSSEEIAAVFGVMAACPQHAFQVLTKRPKRMREWFAHKDDAGDGVDAKVYQVAVEEHGYVDREQAMVCALPPDTSLPPYFRWPLPNVMLGVSAECQKTADERIPLLLETPAAVRFVSAEPLLGAVDLSRFMPPRGRFFMMRCEHCGWVGSSELAIEDRDYWFGDADLICPSCERVTLADEVDGLDWAIVGGESGPGARPCALEWIGALVDQCKTASVPIFVKQLGSCVVSESRACETDEEAKREFGFKSRWLWQAGLRDRKGGDPSEWPEHLRVREFPVMGDEAGANVGGVAGK